MLETIKKRLERINELNRIMDGPISIKGEAAYREWEQLNKNYEKDVEYLVLTIEELVKKYNEDVPGGYVSVK